MCTQGCVHTVALHQPTVTMEMTIVLTYITRPWRNLYNNKKKWQEWGFPWKQCKTQLEVEPKSLDILLVRCVAVSLDRTEDKLCKQDVLICCGLCHDEKDLIYFLQWIYGDNSSLSVIQYGFCSVCLHLISSTLIWVLHSTPVWCGLQYL